MTVADPPPWPGALAFDGVSLELAGGATTTVVSGLRVVVDAHGITTYGPEPGSVRSVPWPLVAEPRFGEPRSSADGVPAFGLTATVAGRAVRWVIPAVQLNADRVARLHRLVAAHGGGGRPAGSARPPGFAAAPSPPRPAWTPPPAGPPRPGPIGASSPFPGVPRMAEVGSLSTGRRRLGRVPVVTALAVAAAALGVGIGVGVSPGGPARRGSAGRPPVASSRAHRLAERLSLSAGDVPAGWQTDPNPSGGPIGALLQPGSSTLTPPEQASAAAVATRYERCMGVRRSQDRIFGPARSRPEATASSPGFVAPGPAPTEVGSQSEVFGSPAPVAADLAQVEAAKFPTCLGGALAGELSALGNGAGANVGTPTVVALTTLPQLGGVRAVGTDVTVSASLAGQQASVQVGIVLIGGGRAETTLVTFAEGAAFPRLLTEGMTASLERRLLGSGLGPGG
ncbi:MAG: hypothetical protein ACYCU7_04955 [Acidimicrobiales bacterium]